MVMSNSFENHPRAALTLEELDRMEKAIANNGNERVLILPSTLGKLIRAARDGIMPRPAPLIVDPST